MAVVPGGDHSYSSSLVGVNQKVIVFEPRQVKRCGHASRDASADHEYSCMHWPSCSQY